MKNIGILGSTGSVGKQALEIIRDQSEKFKIKYLACNNNYKELIKQVAIF